MDAVTYSDGAVRSFVAETFVPLRIPVEAEALWEQFKVLTTPTVIVLDSDGKEHHRMSGFQTPEELIASALVGIAKVRGDGGGYAEALPFLDRVLEDYGGSAAAPEALFLRGSYLYKSTADPANLRQAYERLAAGFPESEWTTKARPYRLL